MLRSLDFHSSYNQSSKKVYAVVSISNRATQFQAGSADVPRTNPRTPMEQNSKKNEKRRKVEYVICNERYYSIKS